MRIEVSREESNVIIGNQVQENTETVIWYDDGSFEIVPPEETIWTEEGDEDNYEYEDDEEGLR
ncbi:MULTISPECIES: hypothetical protein [Bacillus cereus group]|uniref:hypothetical protein n=1 Tax=Bacillus cereus group TaxID=86661 RepID=UPI00159C11FA|nr:MULTISPECIES: hypothetical protein [Bacillus cereus group]MDA1528484.1 hypothetical protein [Bacillus cereus group sp. TH260-2LC]